VWIRAMRRSWGEGTTYDELAEESGWLAPWSDGIDEFVVTGPGEYVVPLPNQVDYWQDVRDNGIALVAGRPYDSDGKTYRFDVHRIWIELVRSEG